MFSRPYSVQASPQEISIMNKALSHSLSGDSYTIILTKGRDHVALLRHDSTWQLIYYIYDKDPIIYNLTWAEYLYYYADTDETKYNGILENPADWTNTLQHNYVYKSIYISKDNVRIVYIVIDELILGFMEFRCFISTGFFCRKKGEHNYIFDKDTTGTPEDIQISNIFIRSINIPNTYIKSNNIAPHHKMNVVDFLLAKTAFGSGLEKTNFNPEPYLAHIQEVLSYLSRILNNKITLYHYQDIYYCINVISSYYKIEDILPYATRDYDIYTDRARIKSEYSIHGSGFKSLITRLNK